MSDEIHAPTCTPASHKKGLFHSFRHVSIKARLITFALFATLIPSLLMGWLSYTYSKKSVRESILQELNSATSHTARELDLWFRERIHDTKVFSSSYVIQENIEILQSNKTTATERREAKKLLDIYLNSIHDKYPDYLELTLYDTGNTILASSNKNMADSPLPSSWLSEDALRSKLIGQPVLDADEKNALVPVGSRIRNKSSEIIGILAMRVSLHRVSELLSENARSKSSTIHLVDNSGVCFVSSFAELNPLNAPRMLPYQLNELRAHEGDIVWYSSVLGNEVIGTLAAVSNTDWSILAERDRKIAFRQLNELRRTAVNLVTVITLFVGLVGSLLSWTIVRPVKNLTTGADKVADGDLTVDIKARGPSEVVFLTSVFNEMVCRLREHNEQLEFLSITDSLTGLFNRKHFMKVLKSELSQADKEKQDLTLMMIDIDYFKRFNDSLGHQAGDEILIHVVELITDSLRKQDTAGRYGGEEFILVLPETTMEHGFSMAEQIRTTIESTPFSISVNPALQNVTVSIGLATFPHHGTIPRELIKNADEALYKAKRVGRNKTVSAEDIN